jgi:hypothetical protein
VLLYALICGLVNIFLKFLLHVINLYLICQLKNKVYLFLVQKLFQSISPSKDFVCFAYFYNYLIEHNKNQFIALFKKAK